MRKEALAEALLGCVTTLYETEQEVFRLEAVRDNARRALQQAEDEAVLLGLEGKNADERAARLRMRTAEERQEVEVCERGARAAAIELSRARNRFSALKAVARLLTIEGGE